MSHISELIRPAPRPEDNDDSLFLIYASAHMQDWLYTIMQWKKINPIDVSSLEPHDTIALWVTKKNPEAIIYCCRVWSEAERKIISKLRSTFPTMPMIVLLEKNYYERAAKRSLRPLKCTVITKNDRLNKTDILNVFKHAQDIASS